MAPVDQVTMKTTPEALRLVRMVAAMTGEKQYEVLERLLLKEHERLMRKETK